MTNGTTLRGSIKNSALVEILQMICLHKTPGVFYCVDGPRKLQVYFGDGGAIIHAVSTNRTVGLEALEELAVWTDGSYRFTETPVAVNQTINKSPFQILTSLTTKIDEWKVLSRVIPSIHLFPHPSVLPGEAVEFNAREARLMEWCNGHFSVEELALAMGQPIATVAKSLYGLILNDFIVLKAVRYPHPPTPTERPRPVAAVPPSESLPQQRPAAAVTPGPDESDWGIPEAFNPEALLQAASMAAPSGPSASAEAAPGIVADYLLYANRIMDAATRFLPAHLGIELQDLFGKCKASIMFDGAANLQTLKTLALDINKMANARMAEGKCDRESIIAYNEEAKRLFGIFKR